MGRTQTAADYLPDELSLDALRDAASGCEGCHLHEDATQTVFGEGDPNADLVIIGEQPGDEEDKEGEPFVGPAGRELAGALEDAGLERDSVWITNVVKHFKFTTRGRRRLHETPDEEEISACLPWLEAELTVVEPELVVCLGASAAKAIINPSVRVTKDRGQLYPGPNGIRVTPTVHPASILRVPDQYRARTREEFRADIQRIADWLRDGLPDAAEDEDTRAEQLDLLE